MIFLLRDSSFPIKVTSKNSCPALRRSFCPSFSCKKLEIHNIYRDDFRLRAFSFGEGEKALCIVGSSRGNEYQQIFTCSRVLQRLKKLEAEGRFEENRQVMVIPTLNPASMNIGKRFWSIDNTDINRKFPGYALGETTQRIAAAVFEVVNKYPIGMPESFHPVVLGVRRSTGALDAPLGK